MTTFTVPSEACQAQFQWTEVQASFPCGFPALEASDLLVQYASGSAATFNGSIAGAVLTATAPVTGTLGPGALIGGTIVAAGTQILADGSGSGGAGSDVVNVAQAVALEAMTAAPAQATLVNGIHYTVTIDPVTGLATVVPIAMPDGGPGTVTVTRVTPAIQPVQLNNLDHYSADAITAALDRAEMGIAELKRRTGILELTAFGSTPAPPSNYTIAPRVQRSIATAGNLPLLGSDSILNINAATDLTPAVPAASTRAGAPLTFKNLPGSHSQTLLRTGGDTFDGLTTLPLLAGATITLTPFNDGVNAGYAIE